MIEQGLFPEDMISKIGEKEKPKKNKKDLNSDMGDLLSPGIKKKARRLRSPKSPKRSRKMVGKTETSFTVAHVEKS
jgi:hypothetical protein